MYTYKIVIDRVVDGDTIVVDIDLGFDIWIRKERVRLSGLDTPETRSTDLTEKNLGLKAKQLVSELVSGSQLEATLYSRQYERGKYGRVIGDIEFVTGLGSRVLWSKHLLESGLVVEESLSQEQKTAYWHSRSKQQEK